MAEGRMDDPHDYLAEHYRELIEFEDIINFINDMDDPHDLFELSELINKKMEEKYNDQN